MRLLSVHCLGDGISVTCKAQALATLPRASPGYLSAWDARFAPSNSLAVPCTAHTLRLVLAAICSGRLDLPLGDLAALTDLHRLVDYWSLEAMPVFGQLLRVREALSTMKLRLHIVTYANGSTGQLELQASLPDATRLALLRAFALPATARTLDVEPHALLARCAHAFAAATALPSPETSISIRSMPVDARAAPPPLKRKRISANTNSITCDRCAPRFARHSVTISPQRKRPRVG